jgi:hypothetical protein
MPTPGIGAGRPGRGVSEAMDERLGKGGKPGSAAGRERSRRQAAGG